jgi:hypothetical protein
LLLLFHHGYLRLSMNAYSSNYLESYTHLTNAAIQKNHPDFQELKEDTIWSMQKMEEYVR